MWADLPLYAQYLIQGIVMFVFMATSAVVFGKTGRSPYWALLVIVPYAFVVMIWIFAFTKWPGVKSK